MAAQRGKDMLLKLRNEINEFVTVAGLRTRRLSFNAEAVDITHSESTGHWRELLSGGGIKKASMSGAGVFKDQPSDTLVKNAFFDGDILDWQVVIPDFGMIEGLFQIVALDYRGEHQGEVTFDISLESAGPLAFITIV